MLEDSGVPTMQTSGAIPGLQCNIVDDVLTMVFGREFDSAKLHMNWAKVHLGEFPGPFRAVRVDLSAQPRLTSNFFSGLVLLHFTYTEKGSTPLAVIKADPRTMTTLRILKLDVHFTFEG